MRRKAVIVTMGVLVLLGATVLMGCGNEGPDLRESERHPVGFDTYTEKIPTRAEVVQAIPEGGSIGVYAYYHDDGRWTTDAANNTPNFMWNQQVTNDASFSTFVYSPLKYWPNEESDKLSFIAYYPYTPESLDNPETPTAYPNNPSGLQTRLRNNDKGLPSFNFTVKDAAENQVDLLVSDLIVDLPKSRDTQSDPGTPFNDLTIYDKVKFVFHHALAKVEFRITVHEEIRQDVASITLTEPVIISNVNKSGMLTTTYTPDISGLSGTSGVTSLSWSNQATPHDYTFKTYEPQLLLPQTIGNSTLLTFAYSMTFKSDGTSYNYVNGNAVPQQTYTYSNAASLQLNTLYKSGTTTPITEWLPNTHYVYNILLRANRIEFTGQVVEWGQEVEWDGIDVDQIIN